jgi:hypothetical protein
MKSRSAHVRAGSMGCAWLMVVPPYPAPPQVQSRTPHVGKQVPGEG